MTNRLRRQILKAPPHAQIRCKIVINEIVERHSRIRREMKNNEIEEKKLTSVILLNSLTAIGGLDRQLLNELHW